MIDLLEGLNSAQQEAVKHINGPLLILAGAGTGKTKTLTTRLAYLIKEVGIEPINTLTLTFTNKSAREMERRALSMVNHVGLYRPLLCTFHKFGLILLKKYMRYLGRDSGFSIIDSEDKRKILKKIIKNNKIDLDISVATTEISKYKNSLLTPDELFRKSDLALFDNIVELYKRYQEHIIENNLVDFDDLLMLPYLILRDNIGLRRAISNRYRYIMVDEYQDTNELQFKMLKLLTSEHNNLCVVGDDDQSIYGWRGANVENILNFTKEFKGSRLIKLETNYRSTSQILQVSNELIEHNRKRIGKRLISYRGDGESVKVLHSMNETIETKRLAKEIKGLIESGVSGGEIAVLYRINALSRSLEDGFMREGLNFKLAGGVAFYERSEIKDLIAYFRVISNPDDDFSLERIINRPRRGIGDISLNRLRSLAIDRGESLFRCIASLSDDELIESIGKRAVKPLKRFHEDIELLHSSRDRADILVELFEKRVNFSAFYKKSQNGEEKVLNIDEFYGYFLEFMDGSRVLRLKIS